MEKEEFNAPLESLQHFLGQLVDERENMELKVAILKNRNSRVASNRKDLIKKIEDWEQSISTLCQSENQKPGTDLSKKVRIQRIRHEIDAGLARKKLGQVLISELSNALRLRIQTASLEVFNVFEADIRQRIKSLEKAAGSSPEEKDQVA